jgi:hypothetical protein
LLLLIALLLAALLASLWWFQRTANPAPFTPVTLSAPATEVLDAKLNAVDPSIPAPHPMPDVAALGAYTEDEAGRSIVFTQDELNAVLAKDPDLARHVRLHLSDDLVTLQILTPLDPALPLLGGRTLRFDLGLSLIITSATPTITVRGIKVGGLPLPGAWWGDIKNKNLVNSFTQDDGFWDLFTRGVDHLEITQGQLSLRLKE